MPRTRHNTKAAIGAEMTEFPPLTDAPTRAEATALAEARGTTQDGRGAAIGRCGFTLLELMIATVLMSVLLAGTWALLGIYQGQFEKSQDRVEQWQLIRSVQSQLTDDLQACHVPARDVDSNRDPSRDVVGADPALPSSPISPALELAGEVEPLASEPTASSGDHADSIVSRVPAILKEWMKPLIGFEGTHDALVLDLFAPTQPDQTSDAAQPTSAGKLCRVVYAFVDPAAAVVDGRPAGLVRCQWKAHELESLAATNANNVDLYALVRQIKLPPAASSRMDPPAESANGEQLPRKPLSTPSSLGFANLDLRMIDEDIAQRIDIVPELSSFVLSYYDGDQWHSSWSFAQRGELPVAVEMRFDLAPPSSSEEAQPSDPTAVAQRLLRERDKPAATLGRPEDDRLASSQTAAPEGYRWLVYLGGKPSHSDSGVTVEPTGARSDSTP